MSKGIDGLALIVRAELGRDPMSGDLFLFVGRDRRRAKVLYFDGTGMCVFYKRLDKGRFASVWGDEKERQIEMTATELTLFIEGSSLVGRYPVSPACDQRKRYCHRDREVVYNTLEIAAKRLDGQSKKLRPWLQNFRDYAFDRRPYDGNDIKIQIQACEQAHSSGYMLWDPSNKFTHTADAMKALRSGADQVAGQVARKPQAVQ